MKKKDFPIFQNNKDLVYLDSAATSQKPQVVLDAMMDYYKNYNANVRRGLYPIAEKATAKVEEARDKVSEFINAEDPSEIIFVRNATEAINIVVESYTYPSIKEGEEIATTIMEHHSNFVPWQQLAIKKFLKFGYLDFDHNGNLFFVDELIKKAKSLAITHASNVLGTINPIKEIIRNARKINKDIVILVDGAQSVPHMKVDVQDLDCDFFVFSGHKMMASTGIGVLYGKKKLLSRMEPFLYGGQMIQEVAIDRSTFADIPYRFEAGTLDIAGIISLGVAVDYLEKLGMEAIRNHEKKLTRYCLDQMEKIEGITLYGPKNAEEKGGIIAFNIERIHPHDIAQVLGDRNICIRAGHHCAMPLHTRLGVSATCRVSFGIYNETEDVDILVKGIQKVKKIFKA
ncbi:MAG: hypothetical protein A3J69_02415 [Candidatus Levybacteria bacterium RIFCSPHIGHO2_02_FULL_42_12]|nr:MAG: hypothetical protein A3J69_02415 [Candidatus Levybacteria bacterium RIFCSPHIGHO2_02_FULL_42_12]